MAWCFKTIGGSFHKPGDFVFKGIIFLEILKNKKEDLAILSEVHKWSCTSAWQQGAGAEWPPPYWDNSLHLAPSPGAPSTHHPPKPTSSRAQPGLCKHSSPLTQSFLALLNGSGLTPLSSPQEFTPKPFLLLTSALSLALGVQILKQAQLMCQGRVINSTGRLAAGKRWRPF